MSVLIFNVYYLCILLFPFLSNSLSFICHTLEQNIHQEVTWVRLKTSYLFQHYPHYNVTVLGAQMCPEFVFSSRIESTPLLYDTIGHALFCAPRNSLSSFLDLTVMSPPKQNNPTTRSMLEPPPSRSSTCPTLLTV